MIKSFFKSMTDLAQKICGRQSDSPPPNNTTIFSVGGHRGSGNTDRPTDIKHQQDAGIFKPAENTIPSILRAFNDGASFVEIDVVFTNDHEIAVTHSNDLRHHVLHDCDEPYFASERTLESLEALKVGPKNDGDIPTLSEVLKAIKNLNAYKTSDFCINIEIKDVKDTASKRPDDMAFFYDGILKSIEESAFDISKIVFSSFALRDLMELRQISPDARLGMLFLSDSYTEKDVYPEQNIPDARTMYFTPGNIREAWEKANIEFVHPELSDGNEDGYALCEELDLSINFWMTEDAVLSGNESVLEDAVIAAQKHKIKQVSFISDEVSGTYDLLPNE